MLQKLGLSMCTVALALAACSPSASSIATAIAQTQGAAPTATQTAPAAATKVTIPTETVAPTFTTAPSATNTLQPSNTPTLANTATATPTPSISPTPTITPTPSKTLPPSKTPTDTQTPKPSETPSETPNPFALSGHGDSVVDVQKPDTAGPAIAVITYHGGSNFVVWNYDATGNQLNLLVNTIGTYTGTVPIDFLQDEQTARFKIKAGGPWNIDLLPLNQARQAAVPSTVNGYGDDVLLLTGGTADELKVDASQAQENFVIWAYGTQRDLLVNDIAPYTGTVLAGSDTKVLVIKASHSWSIEITAR